MRVEVRSELLRWARERGRRSEQALARQFPKLPEWERGDLHPTLKQLETFAKEDVERLLAIPRRSGGDFYLAGSKSR